MAMPIAQHLENRLYRLSSQTQIAGRGIFDQYPYYMALVSPDDPQQALRRTVIPSMNEFVRTHGEADDPLSEDQYSPVPGLVHRYRTACSCSHSTIARPIVVIARAPAS